MKFNIGFDFGLNSRNFAALIGAGLLAAIGCSGGPKALEAPTFSPGAASGKAMEIYDSDGDGYVAGEELERAPALKAALKNLDQDGDGKVSEQEIADRVKAWNKQQIGLTMFECSVSLDGQPLPGALVTFEPAVFLEGVIQEAESETNLLGIASPKIPKDKRPSPDSPPGMQIGLYTVKVSKVVDGKETIPPKYNVETTLGKEVSSDDWAINNKQVRFELKSK